MTILPLVDPISNGCPDGYFSLDSSRRWQLPSSSHNIHEVLIHLHLALGDATIGAGSQRISSCSNSGMKERRRRDAFSNLDQLWNMSWQVASCMFQDATSASR